MGYGSGGLSRLISPKPYLRIHLEEHLAEYSQPRSIHVATDLKAYGSFSGLRALFGYRLYYGT